MNAGTRTSKSQADRVLALTGAGHGNGQAQRGLSVVAEGGGTRIPGIGSRRTTSGEYDRERTAIAMGADRAWVVDRLGLMPAAAGAQAASERVDFYHHDAVGSVRLVTTAPATSGQAPQVVAQFDYLPFGDVWGGTDIGESPVTFAGKEHDGEPGLDYFTARYYASSSGRLTNGRS